MERMRPAQDMLEAPTEYSREVVQRVYSSGEMCLEDSWRGEGELQDPGSGTTLAVQ